MSGPRKPRMTAAQLRRRIEALIELYSQDDFPTWIDSVPRLTRTEVVNDLRQLLRP